MRSERDDRRPRRGASLHSPDVARRMEAVNHRHLHIHEHQIEHLARDCIERRLTVRRDHDPMPALHQQALHHELIDRIVLCHQHVQSAALHCGLPAYFHARGRAIRDDLQQGVT